MKQKDKEQTDAYLDMLNDAKEVSKTIKAPTMKETEPQPENRINNTDTMISIRLTNLELIQLKQLAKASGMSVSKLILNRTLNTNTDV
jgi:predicted DNA binding CopG/RHH family protein